MPDITKLWDLTYIFRPNPIDLSRSDKVFFVLGVALLLIAVGFKVAALRQQSRSPKKHLLNRVFHWGLTMGLLVVIWTGLRFQNIPWLSVHFVVLLLFIISAVWLWFPVRYFYKDYHKEQESWEDEQVKNQYLKGRK